MILLYVARGIAALALLALVAAGVQTWRVGVVQERLDEARAELADSKAANARLGGEVDALNEKFGELLRNLADAERAAGEARAASAEAEKQSRARLAAERKRLMELYAKDPESRAWATGTVPAAVAERVRN